MGLLVLSRGVTKGALGESLSGWKATVEADPWWLVEDVEDEQEGVARPEEREPFLPRVREWWA